MEKNTRGERGRIGGRSGGRGVERFAMVGPIRLIDARRLSVCRSVARSVGVECSRGPPRRLAGPETVHHVTT